MYRKAVKALSKDLEKRNISETRDDVALHEANFVKSKSYRVAKECEIVGGPSLYIIF